MKDSNIKYRLSLLLMIMVSIVFFGFFVYQLWPIKVYKLAPYPLPVLNENHQVKSGEELVLLFSRCKLREAKTTTSSSIVDSGFFYTLRVGNFTHAPAGCTESREIRYQLPASGEIRPGTYRMRGTVVSELPLFKKVTEIFESEEFEVIE